MTFKCAWCGHQSDRGNGAVDGQDLCHVCAWQARVREDQALERAALDRETAETSRQIEEGWLP